MASIKREVYESDGCKRICVCAWSVSSVCHSAADICQVIRSLAVFLKQMTRGETHWHTLPNISLSSDIAQVLDGSVWTESGVCVSQRVAY